MVHVSKACTAEFSVMNMIAWKPLGGYGHLFAHFKLLPCVASCPMPNVVQFALTILLFSSSTNGFIIPYNYGVFWSCSVMAYWVTIVFTLWNTFWTVCIYIYIGPVFATWLQGPVLTTYLQEKVVWKSDVRVSAAGIGPTHYMHSLTQLSVMRYFFCIDYLEWGH